MSKKFASVLAALVFLGTISTGALPRQWTNLRALISSAEDAGDNSMTADQVVAKSRILLNDKQQDLSRAGEKIRLTERQVELREKRLSTRRTRLKEKKDELELAQRKLQLDPESEQLEVGGAVFTRAVIEQDARKRLKELRQEVDAIEAEQAAIALMRSDLSSAQNRLSQAVATIRGKELEIEQLQARHRDGEARKVLESLLPELDSDDSDLNRTLNRLYAMTDNGPMDGQGDSVVRYDSELENQTPVTDDIAAFLQEHENTLASN